jgi:hypothetical protein
MSKVEWLRQEDWLVIIALGAARSTFGRPVALLRSRTSKN